MAGLLYVVATPIGNLEDITYRAVRVLGEADLIACEDTRQTRKLLDHYDIHKPTISYHEHNEAERTEDLMARLLAGETIALVSDAGMPLVSDPGYRLVHAAIEAGISVQPIPGRVGVADRAGGFRAAHRCLPLRRLPAAQAGAAREAAGIAGGGTGHADLLRSAAPHSGNAGGHRGGAGTAPRGGGARDHEDPRGVPARHRRRDPARSWRRATPSRARSRC